MDRFGAMIILLAVLVVSPVRMFRVRTRRTDAGTLFHSHLLASHTGYFVTTRFLCMGGSNNISISHDFGLHIVFIHVL